MNSVLLSAVRIIALTLCLCGIKIAHAEPYIIYDNGKTQRINKYTPAIKAPSKEALIRSAARPKASKIKVEHLPVVTPELTPGRVHRKEANLYMDTPFFIVGADPHSSQWLVQHRSKLKALNAIGIAVNVQTEEQLKLLQNSAGGIRISPVKGGKLAQQLAITHYPVLVSGRIIEQ